MKAATPLPKTGGIVQRAAYDIMGSTTKMHAGAIAV